MLSDPSRNPNSNNPSNLKLYSPPLKTPELKTLKEVHQETSEDYMGFGRSM